MKTVESIKSIIESREAAILPTVEIGDGAGVPTNHIRYRFSERSRSELLEKEWWDWSIDRIRSHKEFFYSEVKKDG